MADISLHGLRDYAGTKKGIPSATSTLTYRHLKDLDDLVKKMNAIRNGSSYAGCSCHGNEYGYGESPTNCSGHAFNYNTSDLSLGQIKRALDGFLTCACDSFVKMYCDCNDNQIICSCNSHS